MKFFIRLTSLALGLSLLSSCGKSSNPDAVEPINRPGYAAQVLSISNEQIARLNSPYADRNFYKPPRPPEYPSRLEQTRFTTVTDQLGELVISENWRREKDPDDGKEYDTAYWGETDQKKGDTAEVHSDKTPWTSWYYPTNKTAMFRMPNLLEDGFAPLQKLDLILGSQAALTESRSPYFRKGAPDWDGHCDAWSMASIFEDEPRTPIRVRAGYSDSILLTDSSLKPKERETIESDLRTLGHVNRGDTITLDVADQKALLTKAYTKFGILEEFDRGIRDRKRGDTPPSEKYANLPIQFGHRYDGEDIANLVNVPWSRDLYPEQWHRFLSFELRDARRPFILETDAASQVWNAPVYQAQVRLQRKVKKITIVERDKNNNDIDREVEVNVISVRTVVQAPDFHVGADEKRSTLNDLTLHATSFGPYYYDLVVYREDNKKGLAVAFGIWTGNEKSGDDSKLNHPDSVLAIPKRVSLGSKNPRIDVPRMMEILGRPVSDHGRQI